MDELVKAADASSEAELRRVLDYLDGSLLSRLNKPQEGQVIVIQQRLHDMDPAGYLLAKGNYRHLNLPAIAEQDEDISVAPGQHQSRKAGDVLCPERMSREDIDNLRRELGSAVFNCQYQQNPTAPEGSPLRWEWFGTYDKVQRSDLRGRHGREDGPLRP